MKRLFPLLILALAVPARASGTHYVHISGTGPMDALFAANVGTTAAPAPEGDEIAEALREFPSATAAAARLEELKRLHGIRGGRVYADFDYDTHESNSGDARVRCGVSRGAELGPEYTTEFFGNWQSFTITSRPSRIRLIARCLAQLPGMPALRPRVAPIKRLWIDDRSYVHAAWWLHELDPAGFTGTPDQYRQAFRCLVSDIARRAPDGIGEDVVVRSITEGTVTEIEKPYTDPLFHLPQVQKELVEGSFSFTVVSIADGPAALERLRTAKNIEDTRGPWTAKFGMPDSILPDGSRGRIGMLMSGLPRERIDDCRRRAGLLVIPSGAPPAVGPAPSRCTVK